MTGKKRAWGMAALMLMVICGLFLTGCSTMPHRSTRKVVWADYTETSKEFEYTIVGVVIIKYEDTDTLNTGLTTLNADLMEKAVEMGAHDIINVRVDLDYKQKKKNPRILAATAVAIKYNNAAE